MVTLTTEMRLSGSNERIHVFSDFDRINHSSNLCKNVYILCTKQPFIRKT